MWKVSVYEQLLETIWNGLQYKTIAQFGDTWATSGSKIRRTTIS